MGPGPLVMGIHRITGGFHHKKPVMRKNLPRYDVTMNSRVVGLLFARLADAAEFVGARDHVPGVIVLVDHADLHDEVQGIHLKVFIYLW